MMGNYYSDMPYFIIRSASVNTSGKTAIQILLHRIPDRSDSLHCRIKAGETVLERTIKVGDLKIIDPQKNIREYNWTGLIPVGFVYVSVQDRHKKPIGREKKEYIVPRIDKMQSFKRKGSIKIDDNQQTVNNLCDLYLTCPPDAVKILVVVMDSVGNKILKQYLGRPVSKIEIGTAPENISILAKFYHTNEEHQGDISFELRERSKIKK